MATVKKADKGKLCIKIKSQAPLTTAQKRVLKKAIAEGKIKGLQHGCRVAEDVNTAIVNGLIINGDTYTPNNYSRARFGKNKAGKPYLTFGVVGASGQKYTVTWAGEAVPMRLKVAAVAHDEGKEIPSGPPVQLPFSAAAIRPAGAGGEGHYSKNRGKMKKDTRERHDIAPDGTTYPVKPPKVKRQRRKHERLSAADLVEAKGK